MATACLRPSRIDGQRFARHRDQLRDFVCHVMKAVERLRVRLLVSDSSDETNVAQQSRHVLRTTERFFDRHEREMMIEVEEKHHDE
jgi:hypothetical protein